MLGLILRSTAVYESGVGKNIGSSVETYGVESEAPVTAFSSKFRNQFRTRSGMPFVRASVFTHKVRLSRGRAKLRFAADPGGVFTPGRVVTRARGTMK